MASGSTGTAHDGWLDHPLSLVGSQVSRACCPIGRPQRYVYATDDRRTMFCRRHDTADRILMHVLVVGRVLLEPQNRSHVPFEHATVILRYESPVAGFLCYSV